MRAPKILAPRRLSRGFTLLETLVAISILGFVASISLPLLTGAPDALRVQAAALRLQGVLRAARSVAVANNDEQVVTLDVGTGAVTSGTRRVEQRMGDIALDLKVADVERSSSSAGNFRFFADGSSTGGDIVLRLGRSRMEVTVDWLTGRATVVRVP